MDSKNIRKTFLDFFHNKNHKIITSSSIISQNDPTLMFNNAGMNSFKDFFIGYKKPQYLRIANTQKCFRVTGKHNDLNDVGYDHHHHTMFEMLGNWSFGDYFKKEAIEFAWDLLTRIYKIPENILYVTVFNGDKKDNLLEDKETYKYWKDIVKNENHIIKYGKNNNFWEMGQIGPCGPCSEIHIDLRSKNEQSLIPGSQLINKNHSQVIEIWNIVFIEFLRESNGVLKELPSKHIDTGMGLERLSRILQNKQSNYDTDIFTPLIKELEFFTNKKYYGILNNKIDISIRIIVDHIRGVSFAISDGQLFSNNGAGYVIRRILRRAINYGYRFLNQKEPLIYKLIPTLVKIMGDTFPEIKNHKSLIENIIKEEEKNFLKTIAHGTNAIYHIIKKLKKEKKTIINGYDIFHLYDTYGLPIDISNIIANENGLIIDNIGFKEEMLKQKNRSKVANEFKEEDWKYLEKNIANNDLLKINFIGYTQLESNIRIIRYRKIKIHNNEYYQLVFNTTPFYPEGGGQVGDNGYIENNNEKIEILNTKKQNNIIFHITNQIPKDPYLIFNAKVNKNRRIKIEKNHSATHLLSYALRKILGNHVVQRGSYIGPDKIRFDFSHFNKLTNLEINNIELYVLKMINDSINITIKNMSLKNALNDGAISIPGENYKNKVRTISFNGSFELCGGTHVNNTINIQYFKILSESSIASGIRRIEALTSINAINYINNIYNKYININKKLNNFTDPIKYIEKIEKNNKILKLENNKLIREKILFIKNKLINNINKNTDIIYINKTYQLELNIIKTISLELRKEINNLFLIITTFNKKNIFICVSISDRIISKFQISAFNIIKYISSIINGKIIGNDFFAMYIGVNQEKLSSLLNQVELYVQKLLSKHIP